MLILVLCPTDAEYQNFNQSFIKYVQDGHIDRPDIRFYVCNCGVGKVNSAANLALNAVRNGKVDLIVLVGYAAGDLHFDTGDIVEPNKTRYHDADVPSGLVPELEKTYDLLGTDECTIMTGDSFVDELRIDHIVNKERNERHLFDMEAAAVAQVGHQLNIPVLIVKMVSDIPQKLDTFTSYEEFVKSHSDFTGIIQRIHNHIIK